MGKNELKNIIEGPEGVKTFEEFTGYSDMKSLRDEEEKRSAYFAYLAYRAGFHENARSIATDAAVAVEDIMHDLLEKSIKHFVEQLFDCAVYLSTERNTLVLDLEPIIDQD